MTTSIAACLAAFAVLILMLRTDRFSFGLPAAYLFSLLLIHIPGAFAHMLGGDVLPNSEYTETGIRLTAIGSLSFVAGVWLARRHRLPAEASRPVDRAQFWLFCLLAGWLVTYGFSLLRGIPSLAAALDRGGTAWMLGVLLGLRTAASRADAKWVAIWLCSLAVFPVLRLLLGGFLSYGTTSIVIVLSVLVVSIRSPMRVLVGVTVTGVLAMNLFLSYFQNRNDIRSAVWGGAPLEQRVDASLNIFRDFEWFDPTNERHLVALDARLNQNYFVGLAAARIQDGEVGYLGGRSLWEGAMALVPRALWPEKPVFGGSPNIVGDMTGLILAEDTSWGVGNVMEFQINFGIPGVVIGFLALGWGLGLLDRRAALAEATGDLGQIFFFFLPAVALVQPNSSIVELVGGAAAAVVAAFGWRWAWIRWSPTRERPAGRSPRHVKRAVYASRIP